MRKRSVPTDLAQARTTEHLLAAQYQQFISTGISTCPKFTHTSETCLPVNDVERVQVVECRQQLHEPQHDLLFAEERGDWGLGCANHTVKAAAGAVA